MKIEVEKDQSLPLTFDTTNPGTGTTKAQCIQYHAYKYGKLVFASARIKILEQITSAFDAPLLRLNITPNGAVNYTPSFIRAGGESFADLVGIVRWDDVYYAHQRVTITLAANSEVEMFFVYQAAE